MRATPQAGLRDPARSGPHRRGSRATRQKRRSRDRSAVARGRGGIARVLDAIPRALIRGAAASAARVYFRDVRVLDREAFPARGPVLLAANHPAAWADVVALDAALDRPLHFLALETLFRPWARGLVLRLHGSLPVRVRDTSGTEADNRAAFERCHELLRAGDVVAVFPEGVSAWDRVIGPLKNGAAWLALEHDTRGAPGPRLVPVAIHYEDRVNFRGTVTIAIGAALDLEPHRDGFRRDPHAAVHALTGELRAALIAAFQRAASAATDGANRERAAHRRAPWWWGALAPLAWAGTLLHLVPIAAIELAARRWMNGATRLAFGRIAFGLFVLPLWYAALLAGGLALGGAWWTLAPAALALGWLACLDHDRRARRAEESRR